MTHDERSPHDREERDGKDQTEGLNAWLDGLATGTRMSGVESDETLAAEWLTANYAAIVDAHLDPARQASTWRSLLDAQPGTVPGAAATSDPTGETTPASSGIQRMNRRSAMRRPAFAPTPTMSRIPARPAGLHSARRTSPTPSGWRLVGSRTMGVAATLLLVAMLAVSGFAVYLTAPRHPSEDPTSMSGIAAGSATPDSATPSVPADAREVTAQNCTAQPSDFGQIMSTLNERVPTSRLTNDQRIPVPLATMTGREIPLGHSSGTPPTTYSTTAISYQLPDGAAPDSALADQLTVLMGEYINCRPLAAASLSTTDMLLRQTLYYGGGGWFLAQLYADSQPSTFPKSRLQNFIGSKWFLFEWRTLDATHVGAYVAALPARAASDARQYNHSAYVVFARGDDGTWRIDDYRDIILGGCGSGYGQTWCNP